jgi:hypothetical protein
MQKPEVSVGEFIEIDNITCIVRKVYQDQPPVGEVVYETDKPRSYDFEWKDGKWAFSDMPDFGGNVCDSDRYLIRLRKRTER